MARNRSILWIDAGGGQTITLVRVTSFGSTIQGQLQVHSNADVLNEWEGGNVINSAPAPIAAPNQSVLTQATLTFLCADNSQVKLALPAPKANIFLADGVTVDQSTITALISACIAQLISQSQSPAVQYISGLLTQRHVPP